MKIVIVGTGRMAGEIAAAAAAAGDEVLATIGRRENEGGRALTPERLRGADVVLEFTTPDAVVANLRALAAAGATVVTGTTGWQAQRAEVEALFRDGPGALLAASNFALGVHLLHRALQVVARDAAAWPGVDPFIHERHHAAKKDAPSGTALALQATARATDAAHDYPVTAVRAGHIPGEHEIVFDAPFETLALRHVARDRRVFAAGALTAARWLRGRRGVHAIDALFSNP